MSTKLLQFAIMSSTLVIATAFGTIAAIGVGRLFATPPDRPAPPAKATPDSEWVPQSAGGPAWRPATDSPVWVDPKFSPNVWPPLWKPGTIWDYDPALVTAWANATAWGHPQWVVTHLPSTPTFPIGWLSVGSVCWDGVTYRMRLAGGTLTEVPTVDLQTGKIDTLMAEREVRAVTMKAFVSVPAD